MTQEEIATQKRIADALERIAKIEEGRQQAADGTAELVLKLAERFLAGRELSESPRSPFTGISAHDLPGPRNADGTLDVDAVLNVQRERAPTMPYDGPPAYGGIIFDTREQLRGYITALEMLMQYAKTLRSEQEQYENSPVIRGGQELLSRLRASDHGENGAVTVKLEARAVAVDP